VRGHEGFILSIEFSADGGRLLTTAADGTARVWDAKTGEPLQVLRHSLPVLRGHFNRSGRNVVTVSDGAAYLWDAQSARRLATFRQSDAITQAVFAHDDRHVITGSTAGDLTLWKTWAAHEDLAVASPAHADTVTHASFSADATRLVTASADGVVRISQIATGNTLLELSTGIGAVSSASTMSDRQRIQNAELTMTGTRLVILAGNDDTKNVSLWDTRKSARIATLGSELVGEKAYAGLASDYQTVILRNADSLAGVFDAETAARPDRGFIRQQDSFIEHKALSVRGDYAGGVVTISRTARVGISNVIHANECDAGTFELPDDDSVRRRSTDLFVAVSDDGDAILVGLPNGLLHVFAGCSSFWRMNHRVLAGHTGAIEHATFGSTGRLLTTSKDGTSRVWNYRAGTMVAVLPQVIRGSFSPDGERLVTAQGDVWDMRAIVQVGTLPLPWLSRVLGDPVDSNWQFAWSPDSAHIVAYGAEKRAYVFPIFTHTELMARARELLDARELGPELRARAFLK
jgi:WD40 repeat protein